MAGLLKNQILKHLSRFAKNLSSDKLKVSTLQGHCELHNLELNEQVLTELLELPSFLQLTRAVCNHVSVKIHWTRLKSVPIYVSLDEVVIEIETCQDVRTPSRPSSRTSYSSGSKYGFSDRVIDGMTVTANSVCVNFKSPVFQASFQLSRLLLESRTPQWKKGDLRMCRVKYGEKGEVLLFKHMEWHVLRIEAKALEGQPTFLKTTPLRLITNHTIGKITIKKKLSDCSVLGTRVVLQMDDLLWVLTDVQLVAAIHFVRSLGDLIEEHKHKAEKYVPNYVTTDQTRSPQSRAPQSQPSNISKIFSMCDVVEPSYHLISKRIDFHLCDDAKEGRSQHPSLKDGGALQISLQGLSVDYYPYSHPGRGRDHWLRYKEPSSRRSVWVEQLLSRFHKQNQAPYSPQTDSEATGKHPTLHRAGAHTAKVQVHANSGVHRSSLASISEESICGSQRKNSPQSAIPHLLSSCLILRMTDFAIYKITTSQTQKARKKQEKFLAFDRKSLMLPEDMRAVHMEVTHYYYPASVAAPAPPPYIYIHLGPVQLALHPDTFYWSNAFVLHFKKCLDQPGVAALVGMAGANRNTVAALLVCGNSLELGKCKVFLLFPQEPLLPSSKNHVTPAVRIEALMPQLIIPAHEDVEGQTHFGEKARSLHFQASRVVASNCRIAETAGAGQLSECLDSLGEGALLFEMGLFPWEEQDLKAVPQQIMKLAVSSHGGIADDNEKELWSVHFDPLWADFVYEDFGKRRLSPFMDPLPLTLWVHQSVPWGPPQDEASTYLLVHVRSAVKVQLNHFQYLFLLRMVDEVTELGLRLVDDSLAIVGPEQIKSLCVTSVLPLVECSFILHTEEQPLAASPSCTDSESLLQDNTPSPLEHEEENELRPPSNPKSVSPVEEVRDKSPACSNCSKNCVLPKSCSDSIVDSGIQSALALDRSAEAIQKGYQTSTAAVKKGLSTLVASIDSIMSKNEGDVGDNLSCCEDDALSIRSDLSSDSDQFIMVGLEEDFIHVPYEVEVASEVREDTVSCVTVSNSDRKNDMLTVLTARLQRVEFVQQSLGGKSKLIVQCQRIDTEEHLAISWGDFQNNFSAKVRGVATEEAEDNKEDNTPCLRARVLHEGVGDGRVKVQIHRPDLTMSKSLLHRLGEMLEDEVAKPVIPATVLVYNLKLHLKDNTSPMVLHVPGCIIEKSPEGVVQVLPLDADYIASCSLASGLNWVGDVVTKGAVSTFPESASNLENLSMELEQQRRENRTLRERLEQAAAELLAARLEVRRLEAERASLQATVQRLTLDKS